MFFIKSLPGTQPVYTIHAPHRNASEHIGCIRDRVDGIILIDNLSKAGGHSKQELYEITEVVRHASYLPDIREEHLMRADDPEELIEEIQQQMDELTDYFRVQVIDPHYRDSTTLRWCPYCLTHAVVYVAGDALAGYTPDLLPSLFHILYEEEDLITLLEKEYLEELYDEHMLYLMQQDSN